MTTPVYIIMPMDDIRLGLLCFDVLYQNRAL